MVFSLIFLSFGTGIFWVSTPSLNQASLSQVSSFACKFKLLGGQAFQRSNIGTRESLSKEMATKIEGGNQDACNATCCICLENVIDGGISTVTHCNHEYHLQCILEWCQRSPNCPTCRQQVSLKETENQELLQAVEYERKMKAKELKNGTTLLTQAEISRTSEEEVQERLRQYMANVGRRYQFSMNVEQSDSSSSQRAPGCAVRNSNTSSVFEQGSSKISETFTRFRVSFVKSTRVLKEKLFCRGNSASSL